MEAFVRNFKFLSSFSILSLIVVLALSATHTLKAQDEMPNDEETMVPTSNSTATPPVIIDESDSGAVSDVDEYDG